MRPHTVVEITSDRIGELPRELIVAAYMESRFAPMVLLLSGVTPQSVDSVLDPVIRVAGTTPHGVRYVSSTDEQAVTDALKVAATVIAATDVIRQACAASALRLLSPDEAIRHWQMTRGTVAS